jgi:hypothetical protein
MARRVEGMVQRVRCNTCAAGFPTFVFSGDTDMATHGLVAVTAVDTGALALGTATDEEYRAGYLVSRRLFAERVSRELDHCMVAVDVARYEPHTPQASSESFQQFREGYSPPEVIYACPVCGGDARVEEQLSPQSFRKAGGELIAVDGLSLAGA